MEQLPSPKIGDIITFNDEKVKVVGFDLGGTMVIESIQAQEWRANVSRNAGEIAVSGLVTQ